MKMNIEVELDFIGEDYSLEDGFRDEIKQSILNRVQQEIVNQVKPMIDNSINESINKTIDGLLENYLNNPVIISNGYKQESYDSVLEMIEKKFTALYDEKFRNKQGCTKDPIMEKINDTIKYKVNDLIDKMGSDIKREGDKIANEAIRNSGLSKALENLKGSKSEA